MNWKPGNHARTIALEQPYEDVPAHLTKPLVEWVVGRLTTPETVQRVGVLMRLDFPGPPQTMFSQCIREIGHKCTQDDGFLLDLVEVLLTHGHYYYDSISTLNGLLLDANSIYRVHESRTRLEITVPPEVKEQVQHAISEASGSAGEHLAEAWNLAFARQSDPVKAYSEAIKAVECAGAPVVTPNDSKATLGKMASNIADKPGKWEFAIESNGNGVERVLGMMRLLWDGQTSRHGGPHPTARETPEAARAAVLLAAPLVQYFTSGLFKLK